MVYHCHGIEAIKISGHDQQKHHQRQTDEKKTVETFMGKKLLKMKDDNWTEWNPLNGIFGAGVGKPPNWTGCQLELLI